MGIAVGAMQDTQQQAQADYVYVTGYTSSPNFPTTAGAWDRTYAGRICDSGGERYNCSDAFITRWQLP